MPSAEVSAVNTLAARIARRCHIDPNLVEDAYPCTSLQASLIAASLQDLGEYVSQFVFDVSNTACSAQAIRNACEVIYNQNAILRTRVIENKGHFFQVATREPLKWREEDNLREYLDRDRQISVVLETLLARFAWIKEPSGKLYLVWTLHHCQYDEWSFQMLLRDLNNLVHRTERTTEVPRRPPFSRFIKALSQINAAASQSFWEDNLLGLSECRNICSNSAGSPCRTSKRCGKSYKIDWHRNSSFQPSELAVAAWSLLVGRLSSSSSVVFGHILNGRTADFEGIQDVCGPTLTTVPWRVDIPYEAPIKDYLEQLQKLRLQILPFEQTCLNEYRKLVGTATFDTLLSVHSSQAGTDISDEFDEIKPQQPEADLSHPCCLLFKVDIENENCALNVVYDDRWIDEKVLGELMDKFAQAVENLLNNLEISVRDFDKSLQLPSGIESTDRPQEAELDERNNEDARDNRDGVNPDIMMKTRKLAVAAAGITDADSVHPGTTLMNLGMDSLKTVTLARQLSKSFQTSVPFKEVAGPGRTLSAIARSIERALRGTDDRPESTSQTSLLELAEKHMRELNSIPVAAPQVESVAQASAVLRTGATGYLGIEILRQCLSKVSGDIVLLVRCQNPSDGLNRLTKVANTAAWKPGEIELLRNVKIWPSDLAKERLGLSDSNWALLNDSNSPMNFKAIIHNGAKVDFLHTSADLEAANVSSTAILLKRHLNSGNKANFVFVTGGRRCPPGPDEVEETARRLSSAGGYTQTKFLSEILIHKTMDLYNAAKIHCRMSIVHPGAIIGSASTGVANTDDFFWRYVAASLSMGCYVPAVPTKREGINLTTVDSVASMTLSCALGTRAMDDDGVERCLMRDSVPVCQFWGIIAGFFRGHGHILKPVSEWEWLAEFEEDLERRGQEHPLFTLSQYLSQRQFKGLGGPSISTNGKVENINLESLRAILQSNIGYLTNVGFFSEIQQDGKSHPADVFTRSKS